ncbi:MAG: hypothetical protein AMK70_12705 [Nitrospira bacterium SG8_35_1]|jgi:hypothetical protein|nr:MAG: hypothetical protein AMK70_12705 [Nitrospira bacterium SG8_35_1]
MKPMTMKLLFIIFPVVLLLLPATIIPAVTVDQSVTISIPDTVLFRAIKDGLPFPIAAQSQYVQGDVSLESLEKLQVMEKSLFIRGVVSGRDFTINTTIAGKDISLNLGSAQLPVSCELFLRFDGKKKILFVRPRFPKPNSLYSTDPADALLLLLSSLGEKEYPVEFGAIQPILAKAGTRDILIELEPVDILTQKGLLLIKMRPLVTRGT